MAGRANAFDVISSELPKWWNDPNQEDLRDVASMVIPQDSSDLALSVLGGPFGRGAKMGAAAFGAAAYSPDAEAGGGGALRLLRRALRNSPEWSKRMLEKVASQTPNALEALDPGSLAHSLRYAREIRQMKPSEFLRAASPMGDTLADRDTVGALRQLLTQGYEGAYSGILDLPVDPYRRSFRGLLDVPYLGVVPEERIGSAYRGLTLDYPAREGVPKVVGHEGRHRMAAIRDVFGDTPIPVEIRSPWQSRYVENLPDSDWAVEQMARSRLVPPPTKYASGGVVGNMNAWLEQKKRQAKRTLSDWFERPEDTARMVASRFDEDMTKHLKDPAAALDYVTGPVGGLAGIMKPKGGNWLPGEGGDLLAGLRSLTNPDSPESLKTFQELLANHPLEPKVAELQSLLEELSPLAREQAGPIIEKDIASHMADIAEDRARWVNEVNGLSGPSAIHSWVQGPLKKYLIRDMATEGDPIRRLADEGILHYNIAPEAWLSGQARSNRKSAGFPEHPIAATEQGRSWEDITDAFVSPSETAGSFRDSSKRIKEKSGTDPLLGNEWINKLPENEPLYRMDGDEWTDWTGMRHLSDELHNTVRPDSDLPAHLRLNPEDFKQMGIERAVRHVDKINKWRADNIAETNAKIANNAATHLVKEYPDTGMRWVEIRNPAASDSRIAELREKLAHFNANEDSLYRSMRGEWEKTLGRRLNSKEVIELDHEFTDPIREMHRELRELTTGAPSKDLQAALKYEGDIMGHCVGGYCDDVAKGYSKIYSLRDAKGRPHVTIEVVSPGSRINPDGTIAYGDEGFADTWVGDRIQALQTEYAQKHNIEIWDVPPEIDDVFFNQANSEYIEKYGKPSPPIIEQIKGKGNAKPKDEYLPYVHDFVQNQGPWADVKDIRNTDLVQHAGRYIDPVTEKIYHFDDKAGHYFPGDIFDGVSTNAVRNAGFKPEGEFSIAELQDWAKANPEQLEEALFRDWMQYTDGDPVEARTLAKEYLSKVLDTNAREFFRNSRNHYAAGGLVQREEQGSGSQGGTTAVSSKNCSCHADGGLIESPGFQAYLKALGDHKDPAEEAAFYREFSRE